MKAALFQKAHEPLTIEDVDLAELRSDEVRVRTVCSGVCHSDLHVVDGMGNLQMPMVLGHESSGVVEQVGKDVGYVKPGDRVILSLKPFCGSCYYCLGGRPHLCNDRELAAASARRITWKGKPVLQMGSVGSFAEYMITSESGVVKIPSEMPMAEAALVGCAVMTGVGAALYTAQVPGGAIAAVVGCGGIGLNIIQGCQLAGASQIIAIDVAPYKLELARKFGATHTIDAKEVDPVKAVKELTGRLGAEYAFEAIGSPATARQAFDMVRAGGTAVVVGVMGAGEISVPGAGFSISEKKLIGCMFGSARFREHMPKLIDLFLQGRLNLTGLVTERMPLSDVNRAFQLMREGKVARSVLEISPA
jgi:S-(hydroxymethyl)glutathione dehydrogenase/alcohol dehydrogenase